jgi:hypothetical protein
MLQMAKTSDRKPVHLPSSVLDCVVVTRDRAPKLTAKTADFEPGHAEEMHEADADADHSAAKGKAGRRVRERGNAKARNREQNGRCQRRKGQNRLIGMFDRRLEPQHADEMRRPDRGSASNAGQERPEETIIPPASRAPIKLQRDRGTRKTDKRGNKHE